MKTDQLVSQGQFLCGNHAQVILAISYAQQRSCFQMTNIKKYGLKSRSLLNTVE